MSLSSGSNSSIMLLQDARSWHCVTSEKTCVLSTNLFMKIKIVLFILCSLFPSLVHLHQSPRQNRHKFYSWYIKYISFEFLFRKYVSIKVLNESIGNASFFVSLIFAGLYPAHMMEATSSSELVVPTCQRSNKCKGDEHRFKKVKS